MMKNYLIRFDDICPKMNWEYWGQLEDLFDKYSIRPIVAVIPDNRDNSLNLGEENIYFWETIKRWQNKGWTIGLHGFQHLYNSKSSGLVGINNFSEFAGSSFETQENFISSACSIFHKNLINPDVWVAPGHSFDEITLSVLRTHGITDVSDGNSVLPYSDAKGTFWVPQQIGKIRNIIFPFGVWTICFHTNSWKKKDFENFSIWMQKYHSRLASFETIKRIFYKRKCSLFDQFWEKIIFKFKRLKMLFSFRY